MLSFLRQNYLMQQISLFSWLLVLAMVLDFCHEPLFLVVSLFLTVFIVTEMS